VIVAKIKDLSLSAVCSDSPNTVKRWKINNPNPFDIPVEYGIYKSAQKGTTTATPGVSYFTTVAEKATDIAIISWRDDFMISHVDLQSSTKAQCAGTGLDIAVARVDYEESSIETEAPFIIDAWPNPTSAKFSIMIAGPTRGDVELEIIGINGQRVLATKTQNNIVLEVDASGYGPGLYVVRAKQLMHQATLRLVKE
jgi:hypothetical protein